jgi:hypothetical protein
MKKIPLSENSDSTHKTWEDIYNTSKNPYDELLNDYSKSLLEEKLTKHLYTISNSDLTQSITSTATKPDHDLNPPFYSSVDLSYIKNRYSVADSYYDKWINYDKYHIPRIKKSEKTIEVTMDDGSIESISREDLIKYISEQRIVRENAVVRKVYERYQVAVKLVRSDDNGDTGF